MDIYCSKYKQTFQWAVVVAQLVERSLPIPEVCGSVKFIINIYFQLY